MCLVYAFSTDPKYWYLIVLEVIFHIATIIFMVFLAVVDPGIIPKIFSHYENPTFRKIPISKSYLDGSVS